ncbi:TPA: LytTR family transcriptional regulator DNA-binding domain-containing protein [Vibrio parahaemolyticus]
MKFIKDNALILVSALFILGANLGLFVLSGIDTTNKLRIEKGVFDEAVRYRASSDLVYENAYYFNVAGLERHMNAFIESFEKKAPMISGCVSLKLISVNRHQQAERVACTRDDTLAKIASMPNRDTFHGESQLKMGELDLGKVQWVVSNRIDLPWYKSLSLNPYLFFIFAMCQLGFFWFVHRCCESRRESQIAKCTDFKPTADDSMADLRIKNIEKIISKNKRGFVLNKDFLYATYVHPYATLHFTNGTTQKILCSLSELENSFSDNYLKISRSCLINTETIGEYSQIKLGRTDKDHVLVIEVKGNEIRQEIGAAYFVGIKDKMMKVTPNKAKIEPELSTDPNTD